ncbi:MAG: tRNA (guanosine(37)-N1)-methyltransferase TrmD [Candidatus Pacebacteria bacterium]|nr:tRNA (guanosine(37)-N1)-methyltransferase TrmD [Candidatus Paceibacterota bacterium]
MNFHIITIFPKSFESYLSESILARAIKNKKIKIKFYNPRDFAKNRRVDYKPYGGGPGMVMKAEPVIKAVQKALGRKKKLARRGGGVKIIFLSPSGKRFDNALARKFSNNYKDIIIICGNYEGVDARVRKIFRAEEISIGDYILTGGALPAMVLVDVVSRQVKGVLGKEESLEENRVSSSEVYTRPEIIKYKNKNYKVPKVLLSGHHKKIEEWKRNK